MAYLQKSAQPEQIARAEPPDPQLQNARVRTSPQVRWSRSG
jgi:hypothetical protein